MNSGRIFSALLLGASTISVAGWHGEARADATPGCNASEGPDATLDTNDDGLECGVASEATGDRAVAIGTTASATGDGSVALGERARAFGSTTIAIGFQSTSVPHLPA